MPLVTSTKEPFDSKLLIGKSIEDLKRLKVLPDIKGLYKDEERQINAILISHSHLDHYGLLNYVHKDIPVYMSVGASELIEVSNIFTPNKLNKINAKIINNKKSFAIGDIKITPYTVDHSAFDALAFLIEAEGSRVFYSGDFRGHGRKSALFRRMIAKPPENISCLLMEGSMLGRDNQICKDEESVQEGIEEILRKKDNIAFLFASSQNIDRLVSAYKACRKTNTTFVIDIYTAFILYRLSKITKSLPQFNWANVRVKFFKYHADKIAEAGYKDLLYIFNKRKIELDEIKAKQKNILMLLRDNSLFPKMIEHMNDVKGATSIYSMWEGYLTDKFKQFCKDKGLKIAQVHTSGHATVADLRKFAGSLNPKVLVPIHTFERDSYGALFKNVTVLNDGEALNL